MIFEELSLKGAFLIKPERHSDERGFFARSFCKQEFQSHGLVDEYVQCNISYNQINGTLRGMHYQLSPHQETKIIRCQRGAIYDVIVDLRLDSLTYLQWFGIELNEDNQFMLYVPEDFAHGFITLVNETELFYHMSKAYAPSKAVGFRWNDQQINIHWPTSPSIISELDRCYPDLCKKTIVLK